MVDESAAVLNVPWCSQKTEKPGWRKTLQQANKNAEILDKIVTVFTLIFEKMCDPYTGTITRHIAAFVQNGKCTYVGKDVACFNTACPRVWKLLNMWDKHLKPMWQSNGSTANFFVSFKRKDRRSRWHGRRWAECRPSFSAYRPSPIVQSIKKLVECRANTWEKEPQNSSNRSLRWSPPVK